MGASQKDMAVVGDVEFRLGTARAHLGKLQWAPYGMFVILADLIGEDDSWRSA
jgi:hypothetical protein